MRFPAFFHHSPVGFVAVHGNIHSAAAGSDAYIEIGASKSAEKLFERYDVIERGSLAHVASVQQNMHAHFTYAFLFGADNHRFEMIDVRVDVAVAEKPQKMKRRIFFLDVGNHFFPRFGRKHLARLNGLSHQFRSLREHLTRSQGVVSDFRISHIVVGGKPHGGAVRFESEHGVFTHKHIQRGRIRKFYRVSRVVGRKPHSVHDHRKHGTGDVKTAVGFFQNFIHNRFYSVFLSKKGDCVRPFGLISR